MKPDAFWSHWDITGMAADMRELKGTTQRRENGHGGWKHFSFRSFSSFIGVFMRRWIIWLWHFLNLQLHFEKIFAVNGCEKHQKKDWNQLKSHFGASHISNCIFICPQSYLAYEPRLSHTVMTALKHRIYDQRH